MLQRRVRFKKEANPNDSRVGVVVQELPYKALVQWDNSPTRTWELTYVLEVYSPPIKVGSRVRHKHTFAPFGPGASITVNVEGIVQFKTDRQAVVVWDNHLGKLFVSDLTDLDCLD